MKIDITGSKFNRLLVLKIGGKNKRGNKMSTSSSSSSNTGIGFTGLLTILFITLKLLGKIDWSWWWVLAPIWISAGIVVIVLVIVGIVYLVQKS